MTFALLVLLTAAPDAGLPHWKKAVDAPVVTALYSRKPNLEKSTGGKVLPAFASPSAFASSKHASKAAWSQAHRAVFATLAELSTQKKPDLADQNLGREGSPVPFTQVRELGLTPNPGAKVVSHRMESASCCDDGPPSKQVQTSHPVRLRRDGEGRITAALFHDQGSGAQFHDDEWRVFTFDEDGRNTGFATFLRSEHTMRLGPEIQLTVCTTGWSGGAPATVECHDAHDDGDEFNFVTRRQVWTN